MPLTPRLVLASSSPYRKSLLARFGLPFETYSPGLDESMNKGELPGQLVLRLAQAKAGIIAGSEPEALVIGCDQVAVLDNQVLTKPGNKSAAIDQLRRMRGNMVEFKTGLCLHNSGTGAIQAECVDYRVFFRDLDDAEIERYVDKEQPYDCAGSFKSEQLGLSLVEKMAGEDPTALIGLPLVALANMLRNEGLLIP